MKPKMARKPRPTDGVSSPPLSPTSSRIYKKRRIDSKSPTRKYSTSTSENSKGDIPLIPSSSHSPSPTIQLDPLPPIIIDEPSTSSSSNSIPIPPPEKKSERGSIKPPKEFPVFNYLEACPTLCGLLGEDRVNPRAVMRDIYKLQLDLEKMLCHCMDFLKHSSGCLIFLDKGEFPTVNLKHRPMPTYTLRSVPTAPVHKHISTLSPTLFDHAASPSSAEFSYPSVVPTLHYNEDMDAPKLSKRLVAYCIMDMLQVKPDADFIDEFDEIQRNKISETSELPSLEEKEEVEENGVEDKYNIICEGCNVFPKPHVPHNIRKGGIDMRVVRSNFDIYGDDYMDTLIYRNLDLIWFHIHKKDILMKRIFSDRWAMPYLRDYWMAKTYREKYHEEVEERKILDREFIIGAPKTEEELKKFFVKECMKHHLSEFERIQIQIEKTLRGESWTGISELDDEEEVEEENRVLGVKKEENEDDEMIGIKKEDQSIFKHPNGIKLNGSRKNSIHDKKYSPMKKGSKMIKTESIYSPFTSPKSPRFKKSPLKYRLKKSIGRNRRVDEEITNDFDESYEDCNGSIHEDIITSKDILSQPIDNDIFTTNDGDNSEKEEQQEIDDDMDTRIPSQISVYPYAPLFCSSILPHPSHDIFHRHGPYRVVQPLSSMKEEKDEEEEGEEKILMIKKKRNSNNRRSSISSPSHSPIKTHLSTKQSKTSPMNISSHTSSYHSINNSILSPSTSSYSHNPLSSTISCQSGQSTVSKHSDDLSMDDNGEYCRLFDPCPWSMRGIGVDESDVDDVYDDDEEEGEGGLRTRKDTVPIRCKEERMRRVKKENIPFVMEIEEEDDLYGVVLEVDRIEKIDEAEDLRGVILNRRRDSIDHDRDEKRRKEIEEKRRKMEEDGIKRNRKIMKKIRRYDEVGGGDVDIMPLDHPLKEREREVVMYGMMETIAADAQMDEIFETIFDEDLGHIQHNIARQYLRRSSSKVTPKRPMNKKKSKRRKTKSIDSIPKDDNDEDSTILTELAYTEDEMASAAQDLQDMQDNFLSVIAGVQSHYDMLDELERAEEDLYSMYDQFYSAETGREPDEEELTMLADSLEEFKIIQSKTYSLKLWKQPRICETHPTWLTARYKEGAMRKHDHDTFKSWSDHEEIGEIHRLTEKCAKMTLGMSLETADEEEEEKDDETDYIKEYEEERRQRIVQEWKRYPPKSLPLSMRAKQTAAYKDDKERSKIRLEEEKEKKKKDGEETIKKEKRKKRLIEMKNEADEKYDRMRDPIKREKVLSKYSLGTYWRHVMDMTDEQKEEDEEMKRMNREDLEKRLNRLMLKEYPEKNEDDDDEVDEKKKIRVKKEEVDDNDDDDTNGRIIEEIPFGLEEENDEDEDGEEPEPQPIPPVRIRRSSLRRHDSHGLNRVPKTSSSHRPPPLSIIPSPTQSASPIVLSPRRRRTRKEITYRFGDDDE